MMRMQADLDLNKKAKVAASEKLNQTATAYECEIKVIDNFWYHRYKELKELDASRTHLNHSSV